ncbi:hypothetical protein [Candidatus Formimonas warabiya]|uniref:Glycine zipper domain-containing protein n=1 Tax=Formimonas warabiya TaxID=1761012 RepID=A0A3G1KUY5_FORW1|nr:hypothetical protein [Candidatus Formimonas warabiya]ATW26252.1 hypothetical protein DCMF_17140 [Candidatus Formimonas warabiya]
MKVLLIPKNVTKWLYGNSPWSWVVAGAAVMVGTPIMSKALRSALLVTAKGVISVADETGRAIGNIKEGWEDIVAEAQAGRNQSLRVPVGAGVGALAGAGIGSAVAGPTGSAVGTGVGAATGALTAINPAKGENK